MPLLDEAGKAGADEFWQSGPICVKVGVMLLVTTMLIVVVAAHCPPFGVNV